MSRDPSSSNPIRLSTGLNFVNIYTIALWINMECSAALFNYIFSVGGGMIDPSSGDIYISETYFSQVVLGYHIAPRRRFTFLSRNLYFRPPPLFQVRYWNFLLILFRKRYVCPYTQMF